MNDRLRVLTLAGLLLFLLSTALALRHAGREIAMPFEGLERLARTPRAPANETPEFTESVRTVDWDAAEYRRAKPNPKSVSKSSFRTATRADVQFKPTLRQLAATQLVSLVLAGDVNDLESLASTLELSASQKERISILLEWRTWSLEADPERAKAINEGYDAAVALELDRHQAEKYQEMKSRKGLVEIRGAALLALEAVYTTNSKTRK